MTETEDVQRPKRITRRGVITRTRIVEAANDLMFLKGVAATTLDDVRLAAGVSKSQFYMYFPDKDELVHAVVEHRGAVVIDLNTQALSKLNSLKGLENWASAVMQMVTLRNGAFGCGLGSLAAELSDVDEDARVMLAKMFADWEALFADGFRRMIGSGVLRDDANPDKLAVAVIAALQGGYLLAQTGHEPSAMRTSLDMALAHIKTFTPVPDVTERSKAPAKRASTGKAQANISPIKAASSPAARKRA